jgi:type IV pilus assembly protein PilN
MDGLRNQTIAAQHERLQNEARMRQPANAAVLDRAHFLNALFLQKSFSWTAVMMDLENVLPTGVQVTSIDPQVTPTGDVIIRLRVSGDRDRAVQLVRNLEHSRRFLQPHLSSEASQAKTTTAANGGLRQPQINGPTAPPGVEFDILAIYNPLPEGEPYAPAKHVGARATRGVGR